MCTGRVDLSFILRAFSRGADGVIVGGCWPGECHYVTEGNYDALATIHLCKKLFQQVGLKPGRVRIEWISASEGNRFAEVMSDFALRLRELGPMGQAEGIDSSGLSTRLDAITRLIPYLKLVEREKFRVPIRTEEAFDEFYGSPRMDSLFNDLVTDKLAMAQILRILEDGPLSSGTIARKLGLDRGAVARQMGLSLRQGLVSFDQEQGSYALA